MGLRLIFFGTPSFAVPSLAALLDAGQEVVAVVSQPDRPRGRGHKVQVGAVRALAARGGLRVLQPNRLKDPSFLKALRELVPDLAVVAAYGRLLPQVLLDIPRRGFVNVHASLLPRWRGAAPVHRSILAGDDETGVTIMRLVLALDAGPMLARAVTAIGPDETSGELEARLATLGARLLIQTIDRLDAGVVDEVEQDEARATYAPKIERGESRVEWAQPAPVIHDLIRGLNPWPLVEALLRGQRLLLRRSAVAHTGPLDVPSGTIVAVAPEGIQVATRPGAVRIVQIQLAGRRSMSVRDFLNGTRVTVGDRLEPCSDDAMKP